MSIFNIDLIDNNWLSALIGIAFSLAIFAVGVPYLFLQTYVPEPLRRFLIENNRYELILKKINKRTGWILFIMLIVYNPIFRHCIAQYSCDKFVEIKGTTGDICSTNCCLKNYNFVQKIDIDNSNCTCYEHQRLVCAYYVFIIFSTILIIIIGFQILKQHKELLNYSTFILQGFLYIETSNEKKIRLDYSGDKLSELYTAYSASGKSNELIKESMACINEIYKQDTYSGKEISVFFKEIIYPHYVLSPNKIDWMEIKVLFSFLKHLKNYKTRSYDYDFINNTFVIELYKKVLHNGDGKIKAELFDLLRSVEFKPNDFLMIVKSLLDSKDYSNACDLLKTISEQVHQKALQEKQTPHDKYIYYVREMKLVIIYCSSVLINSFDISKKFIREIFFRSNVLKSDINIALLHYSRYYQFDYANEIMHASSKCKRLALKNKP